MTSRSSWRISAHQILDNYTGDRHGARLTMTLLAKELGVSRQTVWRDIEIRDKFKSVLTSKPRQKRKPNEIRIYDLESQLKRLKKENGLLIKNIILACNLLREKGLNPEDFISESVSSIEQAFPSLPDNIFYEQSNPEEYKQ
ncbi:HTH domain-containing protein [Pseudomonas sichuanensis]|uniref:HTH domain-containing protein n=1 Tax=Pseudomonas sichuanensis TaxID=2213015 RepID=UPI0036E26157